MMLDHANSKIASGSKPGIDATKTQRRLQTPLAAAHQNGFHREGEVENLFNP